MTPATFNPVPTEAWRKAPEIQPEYIKEHWGHLFKPEYHPEADWVAQFVNSKTVLKCLAEINGTEFHHALKADTLLAVYKEQLANFENITAPALAKEGVSKAITDALFQVYHARAFVPKWEIEDAIGRFGFLGGQKATFRVTSSANNKWPLWKALVPVPFLRTWLIHPEFLSTEQTLGRHATTNEEAALVNVRQFRGVVAFINAVNRGLTNEEREGVKAILTAGRLNARLSDSQRAEIDATVDEIAALAADNVTNAQKKMHSTWTRFRTADEKTYFRQRASGILPKGALLVYEADHHHDEDHSESILREGIHYFSSEADRQKTIAGIRSQWLDVFGQAYEKAMAKADAGAKEVVQKFKSAVDNMLSPEVQADLEIMTLLRSARLTQRQQDEILSVFRNDADRADESVMLDALNPHPVAQRLFGHRITDLMSARVEYTQQFFEGADTNWSKPENWEPTTQEMLDNEAFNSPPLNYNDFNTAMDEILHMKLIRLATDYYDLDLNTDIGLMTFDHLCHNFDISPGEETLDRTHPSPPDHHTYEELPIIKYDGWDECDEEPPVDEVVRDFNPALIEAGLNEWLQLVGKYTNSTPKTVKELTAGNALSEDQVMVLRAILSSEGTDKDRLKLMKKIWGVVVPEKELETIFGEKEDKLLSAGEQHH